VMVTVAIFLLIISSYDAPAPVEYRHAAEASHGEIPKPQGHGR